MECPELNIISKVDKRHCLEQVGLKLGSTAECTDRIYDVSIRKEYSENGKYHYTANGLYLWVNRSGSLREITEPEVKYYPRFSRYLVLHDDKEDRTILLYGARIKNKYKTTMYNGETVNKVDTFSIVIEADLSIPMSDAFEAMRFINNDLIGKMYVNEYENLLDVSVDVSNPSRKMVEA